MRKLIVMLGELMEDTAIILVILLEVMYLVEYPTLDEGMVLAVFVISFMSCILYIKHMIHKNRFIHTGKVLEIKAHEVIIQLWDGERRSLRNVPEALANKYTSDEIRKCLKVGKVYHFEVSWWELPIAGRHENIVGVTDY